MFEMETKILRKRLGLIFCHEKVLALAKTFNIRETDLNLIIFGKEAPNLLWKLN